jgi:restriction endonuclease
MMFEYNKIKYWAKIKTLTLLFFNTLMRYRFFKNKDNEVSSDQFYVQ